MAAGSDFPETLLGLQRDHGAAEVRFERHGRTVPVHVFQRAPCRVLFPRTEPGHPPLAVLITTSGGLAGGDVLEVSIEAGAGAAATVTSQAAEKVYRSLGAPGRLSIRLSVEEGASLDWLPQETILFQGARLERRIDVDVAPGGSLLAFDLLFFGRLARSERFTTDRGSASPVPFHHNQGSASAFPFMTGAVLDVWRVRCGGRLAWADALRLEGDIEAQRASPAGFDGATASGLALLVADDAAAWIEPARERLARGSCRAGATLVGGALVIRVLGADAALVHRELSGIVSWLRAARSGHPARLPHSWSS